MVRSKKLFYITTVALIAFFITGFKAEKNKASYSYSWFIVESDNDWVHSVPTEEEAGFTSKIPFAGKSLVAFKQAVAFKESRGRYNVVNTLGYMGKYQFGKSTLETIGVYNTDNFLDNPAMQEKAFNALLSLNKWYLRKEIEKYSGTVINGTTVTESGILAAAHLAGPGNIRKYLRSNGNSGFKDGYGTPMRSYLKKFGGYDTSDIVANAKARVKM